MPIFIDIAPKEVKFFVCGKKMSGANFNKKGCKALFFWNKDNKKCIYTMYIYSKCLKMCVVRDKCVISA